MSNYLFATTRPAVVPQPNIPAAGPFGGQSLAEAIRADLERLIPAEILQEIGIENLQITPHTSLINRSVRISYGGRNTKYSINILLVEKFTAAAGERSVLEVREIEFQDHSRPVDPAIAYPGQEYFGFSGVEALFNNLLPLAYELGFTKVQLAPRYYHNYLQYKEMGLSLSGDTEAWIQDQVQQFESRGIIGTAAISRAFENAGIRFDGYTMSGRLTEELIARITPPAVFRPVIAPPIYPQVVYPVDGSTRSLPAAAFINTTQQGLVDGDVKWLVVNTSGLKYINDHVSHEAGNAYLLAVKAELEDVLEEFGIDAEISSIARQGPNYAILLPEGVDSSAVMGAVAERFANGITFTYQVNVNGQRQEKTFTYSTATEGRASLINQGVIVYKTGQQYTKDGIFAGLRGQIFYLSRPELQAGRHNQEVVLDAGRLNAMTLAERLIGEMPEQAPAEIRSLVEERSGLENARSLTGDAVTRLYEQGRMTLAVLDGNAIGAFRTLGEMGDLAIDAILEVRMYQAAEVLEGTGLSLYRSDGGSEEFYLAGNVSEEEMRAAVEKLMTALNAKPLLIRFKNEELMATEMGRRYLEEFHPQIYEHTFSNGITEQVVEVDITRALRGRPGQYYRGITVTAAMGEIVMPAEPVAVREKFQGRADRQFLEVFERGRETLMRGVEEAKTQNPDRVNMAVTSPVDIADQNLGQILRARALELLPPQIRQYFVENNIEIQYEEQINGRRELYWLVGESSRYNFQINLSRVDSETLEISYINFVDNELQRGLVRNPGLTRTGFNGTENLLTRLLPIARQLGIRRFILEPATRRLLGFYRELGQRLGFQVTVGPEPGNEVFLEIQAPVQVSREQPQIAVNFAGLPPFNLDDPLGLNGPDPQAARRLAGQNFTPLFLYFYRNYGALPAGQVTIYVNQQGRIVATGREESIAYLDEKGNVIQEGPPVSDLYKITLNVVNTQVEFAGYREEFRYFQSVELDPRLIQENPQLAELVRKSFEWNNTSLANGLVSQVNRSRGEARGATAELARNLTQIITGHPVQIQPQPAQLPAGFTGELNQTKQLNSQLGEALEVYLKGLSAEQLAELEIDITDIRELRKFLQGVAEGDAGLERPAGWNEARHLLSELGIDPESEWSAQLMGKMMEMRVAARYGTEVAGIILTKVDFSDFNRSSFLSLMRNINQAYLGNRSAIEALKQIYTEEEVQGIISATAANETRWEAIQQASQAPAATPQVPAAPSTRIDDILREKFNLSDSQAQQVMNLLNREGVSIEQITAQLTSLGVDTQAFLAEVRSRVADAVVAASANDLTLQAKVVDLLVGGRSFTKEVIEELIQDSTASGIGQLLGVTGQLGSFFIEYAVEPEFAAALAQGKWKVLGNMFGTGLAATGAGMVAAGLYDALLGLIGAEESSRLRSGVAQVTVGVGGAMGYGSIVGGLGARAAQTVGRVLGAPLIALTLNRPLMGLYQKLGLFDEGKMNMAITAARQQYPNLFNVLSTISPQHAALLICAFSDAFERFSESLGTNMAEVEIAARDLKQALSLMLLEYIKANPMFLRPELYGSDPQVVVMDPTAADPQAYASLQQTFFAVVAAAGQDLNIIGGSDTFSLESLFGPTPQANPLLGVQETGLFSPQPQYDPVEVAYMMFRGIASGSLSEDMRQVFIGLGYMNENSEPNMNHEYVRRGQELFNERHTEQQGAAVALVEAGHQMGAMGLGGGIQGVQSAVQQLNAGGVTGVQLNIDSRWLDILTNPDSWSLNFNINQGQLLSYLLEVNSEAIQAIGDEQRRIYDALQSVSRLLAGEGVDLNDPLLRQGLALLLSIPTTPSVVTAQTQ